MPVSLILAVLAGVPVGVALAVLLLMQPPSVPLLIACATVGVLMVLALARAAVRAHHGGAPQPQP
jgi:hypothetical protein